ncbi:hypothetical protein MesoLjLc_57230 [Mesorhizobium sp. L-8-10]|uniref:DUF2076 domain-containing protein n=1 Tax=Mesorhizobium sp. L-8-10 TaxID=2744523 RepID=UPI0019293FCD|nr:DUF2076 domain-containing protein [Mesorhizobium sp. L-8-10]BCH33793.1 hypothetical protein MesoLjLc_57230 [Mesorhizobium sp. L-8-10]
MDRNDQQAIESLFGKLAAVERQSPSRDPQAEDFIRGQIAQQPGAPYYMAQTIVVQEQALEAAQARIAELEAEAARAPQSSGELFSGLFGDGRRPARSGSVPRVGGGGPAFGGQYAAPPAQPARGGGFLAGAAQTAMGVAGGVLLGNAIAGMFGGNEAQAAEEDAGADDAGADDGGFGDMEF